jgi:predicted metal-dependent peptidase
MQISLSEAFTFLQSAKQRNFYARVISALTRVEKPGLGTVAVGINQQGKYILYYDPAFLERLHFHELVLMLEHEVYHLILGHIPRYLDIISGLVIEEELRRFRAAMNVASDCAANELMRAEKGFDEKYKDWFYGSEATDGRAFLVAETFGLEKLKPFEVYLFQLLKEMKKSTARFLEGTKIDIYSVPMPGTGQGQSQGEGKDKEDSEGKGEGKGEGEGEGKGKGNGEEKRTPSAILAAYFDGKTNGAHQFWEQGLGEKKANAEEMQGLADKLRQEAKNIVQKAVEEHVKSRGTIPAGLAEYVQRMLAKPTVPWPKVLRDMVSRTHQSKTDRGMSRPSRRLHGVPDILPFPGKTHDRRFTILYALDTSGSMSTSDLSLGLRELLNIVHTEQDVAIHVLYCDADLHAVYQVQSEGDVDFTIKGRGGTDFNPPFVKCRELLRGDRAPDILIYATDGYAPAPDPDNRVPIPVIWLITPGGTEPSPDYGFHIRMEPY